MMVEQREVTMKKPFANPAEQRCLACDGAGFPAVKQPAQPGLRIYTARCKACAGKGRIWKADVPEQKSDGRYAGVRSARQLSYKRA
jgi:DnaJ-class molecular chaperone